MDNESVASNICVNCGYDFESGNQIKTKKCSFQWKEYSNLNEEFSQTETQIVDAISQVFGLSFHDLYPGNDFSKEIPIGNLALCSECTILLEKLYDSFHGMKKASHDNSLLWNSVHRKRSKISNKRREKYRTKSSKSRTSINIKREILTEPFDDENGFDAYTEVPTPPTPQIIISDNIFEDIDKEDPLADLKQDLKNVNTDQITTKTFSGKVRRRKKEHNKSLLNAKQKTKKTYFKPSRSHLSKETLEPKNGTGNKKSGNKTLPWKLKALDSMSGVVPIKCCNIQIQTDADFISHVNLNHEIQSEMTEEECKFCKRKILSKYMHFHVNVLHQGKLMVYECSKCKKTFLKAGQLARHKVKEDHRASQSWKWKHLGKGRSLRKIFCDKCGKYFAYDYYTRYHLTSVHKVDGQSHPCNLCGKSMKSAESLKQHMSIRHNEKDISRICEKCGKKFPNRMSLSSHKASHEADFETDKEKFRCNQCGILLKHTASLRKHIRLFHGKLAQRTFSCEICGKTTKNMTNMRIHMKVHDPNKKDKAKNPNFEKVDTALDDSITPFSANSYF